jgi:hypothetical protein
MCRVTGTHHGQALQEYLYTAARCAPCCRAGVPIAVDVATDDECVTHLLSGLALSCCWVAVQPVNLRSIHSQTWDRYAVSDCPCADITVVAFAKTRVRLIVSSV